MKYNLKRCDLRWILQLLKLELSRLKLQLNVHSNCRLEHSEYYISEYSYLLTHR